MMIRTVALLVLAAGAATAETPADFAFGRALSTPGESAFYRIELPPAVYEGTVRADVGDLRVFNAAGEVVPYAWLPRAGASREARQSVALPLFPLRVARSAPDVAGLSLAIDQTKAGTSIRLTTPDGKPATGDRLVGYVLDAAAQHDPIVALTIRPRAPSTSFSTRMRVEASDDLASWRTVVADAPLIDLEFDGRRLTRDRIEFAPVKAKYWRVSWPAAASDVDIATVTADVGERVLEPARERQIVKGSPVAGRDGEFEFDLGGSFPVDRVGVDLPEVNSVVPAQIYARADTKDEWRPVVSSVFYRLRQPGGEVTSEPVAVNAPAQRFWQLRIDPKSGGLGREAPSLRVEWRPQQIVFAARGTAPFTLAYGSRAAKPVALSVATLVPGYDPAKGLPANVGTAAVGAAVKAGDTALLRESIDVKRIVLWATLIIAALVLGAMAWRLAKQMGTGPGPASGTDEPPTK